MLSGVRQRAYIGKWAVTFLPLPMLQGYLRCMLAQHHGCLPLSKQYVPILLLLSNHHGVNPTVSVSTAHVTLLALLRLLLALDFCLLPSLSFFPYH